MLPEAKENANEEENVQPIVQRIERMTRVRRREGGSLLERRCKPISVF